QEARAGDAKAAFERVLGEQDRGDARHPVERLRGSRLLAVQDPQATGGVVLVGDALETQHRDDLTCPRLLPERTAPCRGGRRRTSALPCERPRSWKARC